MGAYWSSSSEKSTDVIEWVGIRQEPDASFADDLTLIIALNLSPSAEEPKSCVSSWTADIELDIAHLQATHRLLETTVQLPCRCVELQIPSHAFEALISRHEDDQLTNICALHIRGHTGHLLLADTTLIIDVQSEQGVLRRRVYGVRCFDVDDSNSDREGG